MMKRIGAFIFVVMLLGLACTGLAEGEEFTLRNGIHFGDTMEQVKKLETLPLSSEENNSLRFGTGTIAGIDNSSVEYRFDEKGSLYEMYYEFELTETISEHQNNFDKINSGLERNYGVPLDDPSNTPYIITGYVLEKALTGYSSLTALVGGSQGITYYNEWIVDADNNMVKIDHVGHYVDILGAYAYHQYVGYLCFSKEELSEALQEQSDAIAAVDNDL